MFERVKEKLKENMEDEELEMLLGEIPHAIHHHPCTMNNAHHHNYQGSFDEMNNGMGMIGHKGNGVCMYDDDAIKHHNKFTCASPVSGFSLQSDGSSSSSMFSGHSLSENVSPTSTLEEFRPPHSVVGNSKNHNGLESSDDAKNNKLVNGCMIDEGSLTRDLRQMYIKDYKEPVPIALNGVRLHDQSKKDNDFQIGKGKYRPSNIFGLPARGVPQSYLPRELHNVQLDKDSPFCHVVNLGSQYSTPMSDLYVSPKTYVNPNMAPHVNGMKGNVGQLYHMGFPVYGLPEALAHQPLVTDPKSNGNGMKSYDRMGSFISPTAPNLIPQMPQFKPGNVFNYQPSMVNGRSQVPHVKLPQWKFNDSSREENLIDDPKFTMGKGKGHQKVHYPVATFQGNGRQRHHDKRSLLEHRHRIPRMQEFGINEKIHNSYIFPSKCSSLVEAQGYIYYIAKDQHGCRFLQRMFDDGTYRDIQMIFNEIIGHVVELMINPFGNYLMQKLLEVCNEEQRMQILLKVTHQPGELVRISLNTHGTRVVQKLIETLKTKHQVSLVISALEPGFIALIKDLNGNHVVQRCLQCLSNDDNKFIFVAAAKYCVDIATHQHGCCVLQRCISHSTGEHQANLLAEISTNGILLSQDAFGNYVVQFILELKNPSAVSKLVAQFEGNYVHLSKQKFSSHVVEKCLCMCGDKIQSKIIQELLCESHFEQLLQDPHANYVIQTAVRVTEGPLLDLLLDAIESHRTVSRNSPYSKRIFSHKLLKK